jgi:hypothetical protein
LDEEKQNTKSKKSGKEYKLTAEQREDPFNILGFGMVAFKDLMFTLIVVFTILSVIMLPAAFIYRSYHGYDKTKNAGIAKYSLGNMGYS